MLIAWLLLTITQFICSCSTTQRSHQKLKQKKHENQNKRKLHKATGSVIVKQVFATGVGSEGGGVEKDGASRERASEMRSVSEEGRPARKKGADSGAEKESGRKERPQE